MLCWVMCVLCVCHIHVVCVCVCDMCVYACMCVREYEVCVGCVWEGMGLPMFRKVYLLINCTRR